VRQVYDGNRGQSDPELSKAKLDLTYQAWQRRGFNPTDKSTWKKSAPVVLAEKITWEPAEIIKLSVVEELLGCDLSVASDAVKYVLRFLKVHPGEFAVNFLKKILAGFGIKCQGNHGKANKLLQLLQDWGWIYMRSQERWHGVSEDGNKWRGRARSYGIGPALRHKFEKSRCSSVAVRPAEQVGLRPTNYNFSPSGVNGSLGPSSSSVRGREEENLYIVSPHFSSLLPDWLLEAVSPFANPVLCRSGP
jgi:hypothetical protein